MMNWKGFGRKRQWPNFKVLGGTEENYEISKDSRRPDRDLNPILPEYEADVLTTQPRHSFGVSERSVQSLGLSSTDQSKTEVRVKLIRMFTFRVTVPYAFTCLNTS
jgi:hypothetical protein